MTHEADGRIWDGSKGEDSDRTAHPTCKSTFLHVRRPTSTARQCLLHRCSCCLILRAAWGKRVSEHEACFPERIRWSFLIRCRRRGPGTARLNATELYRLGKHKNLNRGL